LNPTLVVAMSQPFSATKACGWWFPVPQGGIRAARWEGGRGSRRLMDPVVGRLYGLVVAGRGYIELEPNYI